MTRENSRLDRSCLQKFCHAKVSNCSLLHWKLCVHFIRDINFVRRDDFLANLIFIYQEELWTGPFETTCSLISCRKENEKCQAWYQEINEHVHSFRKHHESSWNDICIQKLINTCFQMELFTVHFNFSRDKSRKFCMNSIYKFHSNITSLFFLFQRSRTSPCLLHYLIIE